jgi:hypothetical protein
MRTLIFLLLALCVSCTTNTKEQVTSTYLEMKNLWKKNATTEDVKKTFGNNFKEVDSGIIYTFANSKFPEFGFFFDTSNKLRSQFAYMGEASLESFKKELKCDWKETQENKSIAHYTKIVKKGSCTDRSISYEMNSGLNAFEVRWKK